MKKIDSSIFEKSVSAFFGELKKPPIKLLLPENGLIEFYMNNPPFYDEPKIYGFASVLKRPKSVSEYQKKSAPEISIGFAGGASLDSQKALWKVLGESVERYALFMNKRTSLKSSYNSLIKNGYKCLDPNIIFSSTDNVPGQDKRNKIVDWVEAINFNSQENCLVPTQLIAVPYHDNVKEEIWRAPITTGAAAGSNLEQAILSGICEVVERDAFMTAWLKKLKLKKITAYEDVNKTFKEQNKLFYRTIDYIKRYHLEPEFYILPNDTQLTAIMCVLRDKTNLGPPVTVGLDTDIKLHTAMLGSLEESLQLRPWVRQIYESKKTETAKRLYSDYQNIFTLEQRSRNTIFM